MQTPRWLVINKKVLWVIAGIILLSLVVYFGASTYYQKISVPPEELMSSALDKTINAGSFRFNMRVKVGDSLISDVRGERVAPDSVHIQGKMQDMPVEFIHIADQTFIKGYWSDNWTCLSGNKMAESELFITEFNPLGNFNFKDIPAIKVIKTEEIDGKKMKVMEIRPIIQNPIMELNYEDFVYRVWVDPEQQVLRKAHIQASGINGPKDMLEVVLEMWDFNKKITINKPKVN